MNKFHLIKPIEAVIIALALVGCVVFMLITSSSRGSKTAVITCGEIQRELSLENDGVFEIEGAELEVKNGRIRICNADCPDKLCEKTGFIGASGQSIICVPRKITISISGENTDFDAVIG